MARKSIYYFYSVPFKVKDMFQRKRYGLGTVGKESSWVYGKTVASSQEDAKRRIKTFYKVSRFGNVRRLSNTTFDKPKTRGIA